MRKEISILGQLEELLTETGDMEVTFHRAIDHSRNPLKAAQQLDQYKAVQTILTSGGYGDWTTRLEMLLKMKDRCKNTDILIGSGLTKDNILEVHEQAGTGSYHFGSAVRAENSVLQSVSLEKATEIINLLKNRGKVQ
jgi:copper homeostasis protein